MAPYSGFLGAHPLRIDEKGRLILPAKFRGRLEDGVVLTKGQERTLFCFPTDEFARYADNARTASLTSKPTRDYLRLLYAGASDQVPDKQGRITIPADLRQYAGLERGCVVIGADTRLEIWNDQAWQAYLADQEPAYSTISTEVLRST